MINDASGNGSSAFIGFGVGFCGKKCYERGRNRHIYDCGGLLPCICLSDFDGKEVDLRIKPHQGPIALAAFNCIAKTDPQRLLDYICSTGDYEASDRFNASKHQL
nr:hypothetical transcript [Hymenolepis microstoma]